MTWPDAAAWIGVPYETPMSIPVCMRPQRIPNGLTTGPLTGQMNPLADGAELGGLYEDAAWAAWIWAPRAALTRSSAWDSAAAWRSLALTSARLTRFVERAETSSRLFASSSSRTARTCSVRACTARVSEAPTQRALRVFA